MANSLKLEMKFPSDAEIASMLGTIPKLEQYKVTDKVVAAGAEPVVKRARELAPRSSKTGTSKKRSKNQRGKADWDYPLWKTIKRVIRRYGSVRGLAVVGPEWPRGNKAYFNTSPKGRKVYYWGKNANKTAAQVRNWIVQAFDETKEAQLSAMKAKLTETVDAMMKGG